MIFGSAVYGAYLNGVFLGFFQQERQAISFGTEAAAKRNLSHYDAWLKLREEPDGVEAWEQYLEATEDESELSIRRFYIGAKTIVELACLGFDVWAKQNPKDARPILEAAKKGKK